MTQSFDGTSFLAYGNLYETQSYLGSPTSTPQYGLHWEPINAHAFDALDRLTSKLTTKVCADQYGSDGTGPVLCPPTVEQQTSTYDASGEYGLLSQTTNADGTALVDASYDAVGRLLTRNAVFSGNASPYSSYTYDPDGRTTSVTNPVGTQTWEFDADGRLTQTVEPSALQNYAAINYAYYGNGQRASMQLSPSGGSTYTQGYDYEPTGELKAQTFAGDGQNYSFAWMYTPAGRVTAFTAPASQNETLTYDSYGRVSGLTSLTKSYSGYRYDAAGEKVAYTESGVTTPARLDYNLRGELVGNLSFGSARNVTQQSANGHLVDNNGSSYCGSSCTSDWDARTGALLGPDPRRTGATIFQSFGNGSASYDARGELSKTISTGTETWNASGQQCTATGAGKTDTYTYDVEGRTLSQDGVTIPGSITPNGTICNRSAPLTFDRDTYQWGPNGHVVKVANSSTSTSGFTNTKYLHWDGDSLAFTSLNGASGYSTTPPGIDEIFIGNFATYFASTSPTTSGLTVIDRDESGQILGGSGGFTPSGGAIDDLSVTQPRTDGYQISMTMFQGVRAFDAGSAQWTTPDAYAGDVDDPMSQQKYMWDGNNPVAYADPSGYATCTSGSPQCASPDVKAGPGPNAPRCQSDCPNPLPGLALDGAMIALAAIPVGGEIADASIAAGEAVTGASAEVGAEAAATDSASGSAKVLQTGGNKLKQSTVDGLGMSRGQAKNAIEGLKKDIGLRNDFHQTKIMSNGDIVHAQTKEVLGNLWEYVP
jgi:YD repeat-containing protein